MDHDRSFAISIDISSRIIYCDGWGSVFVGVFFVYRWVYSELKGEKMREFLFRGWTDNDGGYWTYGYLFVQDEITYILEEIHPRETIDELHKYAVRVHPESVGQYTGLTDTDDLKIFEGDIVELWTYTYIYGVCEDECWEKKTYAIRFENGRFVMDLIGDDRCSSDLYRVMDWIRVDGIYRDWAHLKVVGNIYDSPYVLEGESQCMLRSRATVRPFT